MTICSRALVLGMGRSGRAVAGVCQSRNIPFLAFDDKKLQEASPYPIYNALDASLYPKFCGVSLGNICVVAPGIPLQHPLIKLCQKNDLEVISEVEFAYRMVEDNVPNMVAVTGTNGKTTVVLLLEHILKQNGTTVEAIGNIGTPMAEVFSRPKNSFPNLFVVEISSFQLMTTKSPMFAHGVCLNITPNHLDWHSSMEEYRKAKMHLGDLIRPGGTFACYPEISPVAEFCVAHPHAAEHEKNNFAAAFHIAKKFNVSINEALSAYRTFVKPHHRIEFVGARGLISYYNDSKSTNVAATLAAVSTIPGKVVLIAGGVHKGSSYLPWKEPFIDKVIKIVAIGQASAQIASELKGGVEVVIAQTMNDAVQKASNIIGEPYSVLLSPGCSSFDMFVDYKDRGDRFAEAVRSLGGLHT